MSKTVHPYSFRLGILRDWKSRWFATKRYAEFVKIDTTIRTVLTRELRGMYVRDIEIERSPGVLHVMVHTSRPGLVIGRKGEGTTKIKNSILRTLRALGAGKDAGLKLSIEEVRAPETHARIVAQMVAENLERRMSFRRVIKQMLEKVMANREVRGARITVSGRLDGNEMSRRESVKAGQIPLQTLRADVDFAHEEARLPYGTIGVKAWVFKGEVFEP